jgi:DNA-binding NtrC family response regulator
MKLKKASSLKPELSYTTYSHVLVDEPFAGVIRQGWALLCQKDTAHNYGGSNITVITKPFSPADIYRYLSIYEEPLLPVGSYKSSLVGTSTSLVRLKQSIEKLAPHALPIYIYGETGVGKELVARELHKLSNRKGEFVALNVGGLSDELLASELFGHEKGAFTTALTEKQGLFELAAGGTLFLDEVGDMSTHCQALLLRVLETGTFMKVGGVKLLASDARVLCATNKPLDKLVRADLYYRLNGATLLVPTLRERIDDLPLLTQHFLGHDYFFTEDALDYMKSLKWRGNIRELRQLCKLVPIFSEQPALSLPILQQCLQQNLQLTVEGSQERELSCHAKVKKQLSLNFDHIPSKKELLLAYYEQLSKLYEGTQKENAIAKAMGVSRQTVFSMKKLFKETRS